MCVCVLLFWCWLEGLFYINIYKWERFGECSRKLKQNCERHECATTSERLGGEGGRCHRNRSRNDEDENIEALEELLPLLPL